VYKALTKVRVLTQFEHEGSSESKVRAAFVSRFLTHYMSHLGGHFFFGYHYMTLAQRVGGGGKSETKSSKFFSKSSPVQVGKKFLKKVRVQIITRSSGKNK